MSAAEPIAAESLILHGQVDSKVQAARRCAAGVGESQTEPENGLPEDHQDRL